MVMMVVAGGGGKGEGSGSGIGGCASSSLSGVAAQHQDQSEAKQSPLTTSVEENRLSSGSDTEAPDARQTKISQIG